MATFPRLSLRNNFEHRRATFCECSSPEEKVRLRNTKKTSRYRWIEAVPIRDGFEIFDAKGMVKHSVALGGVTSLPVSKDNVAEGAMEDRERENESFNVLTNHGYEFEHNFGCGQKFLALTLAALNLFAFAWHTVLELWGRLGKPPAKPPPSEPASSLPPGSSSWNL